MNKKLFVFGMVAIMLATVFVGCKKGENDPTLSLLSRKARISGIWELTSASYTEIEDDNKGEITTTVYTYDGSNLTETVNGDGVTYPFSEKITIDKEGTFKMETTESHTYEDWNGDSYTVLTNNTTDGVWYFVGGNSELDVKNKERVEFLVQSTTYSSSTGGDSYSSTQTYSGKSNVYNHLLLLDKLAKKELVTLFDFEYSDGEDTESVSGTKTYTKSDE